MRGSNKLFRIRPGAFAKAVIPVVLCIERLGFAADPSFSFFSRSTPFCRCTAYEHWHMIFLLLNINVNWSILKFSRTKNLGAYNTASGKRVVRTQRGWRLGDFVC